ncbi:Zinc finger MYND-type [Penicillium sp. IBT 18751x]|nr:Zinc finger MYND-type [Penicillium sp. IBT 18751x]
MSITASRVKKCNTLRRPERDAWGAPNHYHFSRPHHVEGRARITPLSPDDQAKIIVSLLLESFITRFDEGDAIIHVMPHDLMPWAPWSWSTTDDALARAVSARLEAVGVRSELCQVKWSESLLTQMTSLPADMGAQDVGKWCGGCGFTPSLDTELLRCARCKQARYCTKACQKEDWKLHKNRCTPCP